MSRALELAARGFGDAQPNPMVGAVIVAPDGRIIGEGWHRKCGQGHAEVNAIASVRPVDMPLLSVSTMYVTLEPCSHWGRTPPCAKLLIDKGIKQVFVATVDPFAAVSGRGIRMLTDAGIDVSVGLLSTESRRLNAMFMTANEQRRPFTTLKWAQSADGYVDGERTAAHPEPYAFSVPYTRMTGHRLRAMHQAVMVGSGTYLADLPKLNTRLWDGNQPIPVILDRRHRLDGIVQLPGAIVLDDANITGALKTLYDNGITSVLVEGGSSVLQAFFDAGLYDAVRVETAPWALHEKGTVKAPIIPSKPQLIATGACEGNRIDWYSNNSLFTKGHPLVDIG